MPKHNGYFPIRVGNQIIWLRNFVAKIGNYPALTLTPAEITAVSNDVNRSVWLLETVQAAAQNHAQAISAHIALMLNGSSAAMVPLPDYSLPADPLEPGNVMPGALKRVFAFIANLKTRPGCTDDVAEDLDILGTVLAPAPDAVPNCKASVGSGKVRLGFQKIGHLGILIQSQTGDSTVWGEPTVASKSPYNDIRPLAVAGQPEMRRYRACYWDGTPTEVWCDTLEVAFGG